MHPNDTTATVAGPDRQHRERGAGAPRRLRTAVLAAALLLGAAAPMAQASDRSDASVTAIGQAADSRVALAGTTTVTGTGTLRMPVTIPQQAVLRAGSENRPGGTVVEGDGRFVGFALVADDPDLTASELTLVGGRVETPTNPYTFHFMAAGLDTYANDATLPAGHYLLYLITDGKPGSVTLTLEGLDGTATVAPTTEVKSTLRKPTARLGPGGAAYSAGDHAAVTGRFLMLTAWGVDQRAVLTSTTTPCFYDGAPSGPAAYGPGCPGGEAVALTSTCADFCRSPEGGAAGIATATGDTRGPERTLGQGLFQSTVGLQADILDPVRTTALWLELDTPAG